jgi:outer membrane receptor protein involved in Fe transport
MSGLGWEVSPGLGLELDLGRGAALSAHRGRSFRQPSFTDLYYDSPATVGNRALRPEQAWSDELLLRLPLSRRSSATTCQARCPLGFPVSSRCMAIRFVADQSGR